MIPQVSRVKAAVPSSLTQINGVVKLCVACDVSPCTSAPPKSCRNTFRGRLQTQRSPAIWLFDSARGNSSMNNESVTEMMTAASIFP